MSEACSSRVTLIGITIDVLDRAGQDAFKVANGSYHAILHAFANQKFNGVVDSALRAKIAEVKKETKTDANLHLYNNLYGQNLSFGDNRDDFIEASREDAGKELEKVVLKTVSKNQNFKQYKKDIEKIVSQVKCTPTGLYFDQKGHRWVLVLMAISTLTGIVYWAKQDKKFSGQLSNLLKQTIKVDKEISIGNFHFESEILNFGIHQNDYNINFKKIGLSRESGARYSADWEKVSANINLQGHYDGTTLISGKHGLELVFETKKYILSGSANHIGKPLRKDDAKEYAGSIGIRKKATTTMLEGGLQDQKGRRSYYVGASYEDSRKRISTRYTNKPEVNQDYSAEVKVNLKLKKLGEANSLSLETHLKYIKGAASDFSGGLFFTFDL